MIDETKTPQTDQDLSPLEPENVSTEGFQGDQTSIIDTYVEKIKTPSTASKLNLVDKSVLEITVDDEGNVLDEDGSVIEIKPDPEQPIVHLMKEVDTEDEHHHKTKVLVEIGIATLAAIAAGITVARFISNHRPPKK